MSARVRRLIRSFNRPSLDGVTRFLLAMLLAFSMAVSGPAFAAPTHDCPMGAAASEMAMPAGMSTSSGMPMPHERMGCCTSDCALVSPPAMVPTDEVMVSTMDLEAIPAVTPVLVALRSFNPAAADPPPRPGSV